LISIPSPLQTEGGTDGDFDVLGGAFADQVIFALDVGRMAESNSSPLQRTDLERRMPPREITATSLVPPPMSTTIAAAGLGDRKPGSDCRRPSAPQ
jgi:hypothetical protein